MVARKRRPLYSGPQTQTRRATIYARYSSDMQREGWSAEAQLADLRRYCEAHGWEVVGEFLDEAKSGKTDQRPEFQKALATIRDGRATVFIVHKLDRFSRNMEDTFRLVNEFEDLGAGLVCTQQGIDTTNPISGKIVLAVLAALAEAYLDNLSEETAKGKRARVEAGLSNGDLSYGYANPDHGTEASGAGINNSTVPVVVPARVAVVRQAYEMYATGQHSHAGVAKALNDAGHRMVSKRHPKGYPFTKDTVTALLDNRSYLGEVCYGDAWLPGQHEAIIGQELFDRVRAAHARKRHVGRRGSTAGATRVYLAAGLVRCACCQQPLRATAPNGTALTYRDASRERGIGCATARRTIDGATVDDALSALVGALALPEDWRALALDGMDDARDEARRVHERRQALDRQLEQAQRYLLDGLITEDLFMEKRAGVEAERATLAPPTDGADMDAAAALLADLGALWEGATDEERRDIARALFDAVWVDLDGRRVVAIQMKSTLRALRGVLVGARTPATMAQSDTTGGDYGRMRNRRDSIEPELTPDSRPVLVTCGLIRRIVRRPSLGATTCSADPTVKVGIDNDGTLDKNRREAIRRAHGERIVAMRQEGQTWATIAGIVGLSASRVRKIYATHTVETRSPADDASILDNLRLFCEQADGPYPTRRAYARWPGRTVSPTTVGNRFGGWRDAIERAYALTTVVEIDDSAILTSLRSFEIETGQRPTSRTYDAWEKRIVAHRAIERRFGSWQQAVELACQPQPCDS